MTTLSALLATIGAVLGGLVVLVIDIGRRLGRLERGRDPMAWSDKKVAEERAAAAQAKADRDRRATEAAEELAAKRAEADAAKWARARRNAH